VEAVEKQVSGLKRVVPVQSRPRIPIKYENNSATASVTGTIPGWREIRAWDDVARGEYLSEEDVKSAARVAVIGQMVAKNLFGDEDPLGKTIRIENVGFTVKGITKRFSQGEELHPMDNRIAIPVTTFSRRLFNVKHITLFAAQVKEITKMDELIEKIAAVLRERHHITPPEADDFTISKPKELVTFGRKTDKNLTMALSIISALSLLAGGVVLMNIMLISVNERIREVGLRRAVGARKRDILFQFLVESSAATISGGILGILIAILVVRAGLLKLLLQKAGTSITSFTVPWEVVMIGLFFSMLVGIGFGIYPAQRAARLSPVEALRTE